MKEQLISFKTAKLAKEKGFKDHMIGAAYSLNGYIWTRKDCYSSYEKIKHKNPKQCFNRDVVVKEDALPAPTQALLQKWLRDTKDIVVYCIPTDNILEYWMACVNGRVINIGAEDYTYEEALEKGLQEALTLIYKE